MRKILFYGLVLWILGACNTTSAEGEEAFSLLCQMTADQAQPMAIYRIPETSMTDASWEALKGIADEKGVQIQREEDFPENMLFPHEWLENSTHVLIYTGDALTRYRQWKEDAKDGSPTDFKGQQALARRLGRLLGFSPQGINRRLQEHTGYRTLSSFEVERQTTHLYYADLPEAMTFYSNLPGLTRRDSNVFQIAEGAYLQLHAHDEKHPQGQEKSTAIALLTDQLPAWYSYIQDTGVPVKYPLKIREGGPHDGFVAVDPGGYLLEFEQFKQHPENERFMASLERLKPSDLDPDSLTFYGSITWTYHRDLLAMQRFYEEDLGYTMVADQGWTKIYQTTEGGFIGLVDEQRGMQDYSDDKAVEIEWSVTQLDSLRAYASGQWETFNTQDNSVTGPEKYRYRFSR